MSYTEEEKSILKNIYNSTLEPRTTNEFFKNVKNKESASKTDNTLGIKVMALSEMRSKINLADKTDMILEYDSVSEAYERLLDYVPVRVEHSTNVVQKNTPSLSKNSQMSSLFLSDHTVGYNHLGKIWDYRMNSEVLYKDGQQAALIPNITGKTWWFWHPVLDYESMSSNGSSVAYHYVRYTFTFYIGIGPIGIALHRETRTMSDFKYLN